MDVAQAVVAALLGPLADDAVGHQAEVTTSGLEAYRKFFHLNNVTFYDAKEHLGYEIVLQGREQRGIPNSLQIPDSTNIL